jgi:hypothetical protein
MEEDQMAEEEPTPGRTMLVDVMAEEPMRG